MGPGGAPLCHHGVVLATRDNRTASALEAITFALGSAGLIGWLFASDALSRLVPGFVAMQPTTALDLMLLAIASSCAMRAGELHSRRWLAVTLLLTGTVLVFAGVAWAGEITNTPYPFTSLAIVEQNDGRMSGITAIAHLTLAVAVVIRAMGSTTLPHALGLIGLVIGLIGLFGYAFGTNDLYDVGYFQSIALHTAIGITCVSGAVVLRTGEIGLTRLARSNTAGGRLVRILLPAVAAVPAVLGLIGMQLLRRTDLGPGFVIALLSTSVAVSSGALVWLVGNQLRRSDVSRLQAVEAERRAAAALTELGEVTAKLDQTNRDLRDFTSAAAHDLRGPLGAISMGLDMMSKQEVPDASRRILDRIRTSADRGFALIDDLLTYEKVGLDELHLTPIALDALCREVIEEIKETTERPVELETSADGAVLADPALTRQLLTNLLSNAMTYTPGDDVVHIRVSAVREMGGTIEVCVADRGADIPPGEREAIFEIFRRGTTATNSVGTGVGLAICRRIVERHGGSIRIRDVAGWSKGFVFTLRSA
jgi:signal transduction histidine kinase